MSSTFLKRAFLTEDFRADLRTRLAMSVRIAAGLGVVAFTTFALVDPFIVIGPLRDAYLTRAVVVCAMLLLGALSYSRPIVERFGLLLAVACALVTGGGVIALTLLTGGGESRYHEALLLTLFGYALLPLPWQPPLVAAVFFGLVFSYDVVMIVAGATGSPGVWFSDNAVLWMGALIAFVLYGLQMRLRQDEFDRRQELGRANAQLTELDRAKSRFFANLSHELRTPLTLTLAPVQGLLREAEKAGISAAVDKLRLVERNAIRLLRLVDDLLELTRAEAASLRLSLAEVDLRALLAVLVDDVAPLAERKELRVTLADGPVVPAIRADAAQVERVVLNLLSNAVKFTDGGGAVTVSLAVDGPGVVVEVKDTGRGIAPEALDRIFERFFQADAGSTRRHGGTGIGLSLARELVELHGGRITAESVVGQGTTVRVFLPTSPPEAAPVERRQARRDGGPERRRGPGGLPEWHEALRKERSYRLVELDEATERRILPRRRHTGALATVLVVEDNRDMIRFLGSILGAHYDVMCASDGEEGLLLAGRHHPDVILSDVMMPKVDGHEMLRRLRADEATRGIPVILLTALGRSSDRIAGRADGADAYLTKPFSSDEVLAAVRNAVDRSAVVRGQAADGVDEALGMIAGGLADAVAEPLEVLEAALRVGSDLPPADAAAALVSVRQIVADLRSLAQPPADAGPVLLDLDHAVRSVVAAVPRDGQRREVRVQYGAPRQVSVRPGRVERALLHVLAHASRSTHVDGVVRVSTAADGPTHVHIAVRDDGPGIPIAHAERVFLPFHRDDAGVGLAVARRLLDGEGGSLYIQSDQQSGTTYVLRLPVHPAGSA